MSWRFLAFIDVLSEFRGGSWPGELSGKFYLEIRHSELFLLLLFLYLFIWLHLFFGDRILVCCCGWPSTCYIALNLWWSSCLSLPGVRLQAWLLLVVDGSWILKSCDFNSLAWRTFWPLWKWFVDKRSLINRLWWWRGDQILVNFEKTLPRLEGHKQFGRRFLI